MNILRLDSIEFKEKGGGKGRFVEGLLRFYLYVSMAIVDDQL